MYEKYSVLFVDDEVNILSSLKRGLIYEEYKCYFASSGKEALEVMERERIAVIVSDMRMPGMDGLCLLKEIKGKWPQTVRIVLSGYTQLQQILTTINQVDVFKFITKPWKLEEEFKYIIYSALDFYKLQEENEEYKIALQKKNHAYQNILKSIDTTIANSKRSSEILAACGKAILNYNRMQRYSISEEFGAYQESIFEYFTNAVTGDEKEYDGEKFAEEFSQYIQSRIKVSRIHNEFDKNFKIKFIPTILDAVLMSCINIFQEEFIACGLLVGYGITAQKDVITISLTCINASSAHSVICEYGSNLLDTKIDFINSILVNTLGICGMSFCITKANENLVIVISINPRISFQ